MGNIPHLSNSAISMERTDLELMLESLVSLQRVSAEMSALLTERLDLVDGDLDLSPDGDELDGTGAEDDFVDHSYSWRAEPGCPISDPDACSAADDNVCGADDGAPGDAEDEEDDDPAEKDDHSEEDDPAGQCDEDGINTVFLGRWNEGPGCTISDPDAAADDQGCDDINDDREEEESLVPDYGIDQTAGMLPFHPGVDRAILRVHRDYIRATRCDSKRSVWGEKQHRLAEEPVAPTKAQLLKRKRGVPKRPRP